MVIFLRICIPAVCFCLILPAAGAFQFQPEAPTPDEIQTVAALFDQAFESAELMRDDSEWRPDEPAFVPSWTVLKEQMLSPGRSSYAEGNTPPFIMMAGYMDTDITWEDGGTFTMLAWAWDAENDVVSVRLYYDGQPTDVYLRDDGSSGDFEAGDGLYGLMFEIAPYSLPPGEYILELRAEDARGNLSDLWPYLTIHP
ncbi:MAG TPA: hypothetical protein PLV45_01265 [bacterium]|nr:hypothetical protein [bacterium]